MDAAIASALPHLRNPARHQIGGHERSIQAQPDESECTSGHQFRSAGAWVLFDVADYAVVVAAVILKQKTNTKLIVRLAALTVFMFGFGYALVPLYDTFCLAFGLNGKTGITDNQTALASGVDETRWITVQFTSHTASGLPWQFAPAQNTMQVRPGQLADVMYTVQNKAPRSVVGRATYSVAPAAAAVHFKKTECFCFTNQALDAGESKEMPVRFVVNKNLPTDINTITLSYSFFNAEKYLTEKDIDNPGEAEKVSNSDG